MASKMKILVLGLSLSIGLMEEVSAAGGLLEATGRSLGSLLRQSPRMLVRDKSFVRPGCSLASSFDKVDWNKGHVPAKPKRILLDDKKISGDGLELQKEGGSKLHFDPIRSLYYYYIEAASVAQQRVEVKKPIIQDDDVVVYELGGQKKSLKA